MDSDLYQTFNEVRSKIKMALMETSNIDELFSPPLSPLLFLKQSTENVIDQLIKDVADLKHQLNASFCANEINRSNWDNILNENAKLKIKVEGLVDHTEFLDTQLFKLEKRINKLDQYGRRWSLEISNIPGKIKGVELENVVFAILTKMDIFINRRDIQAIHRLQKKRNQRNQPAITIVRFVNRIDADKARWSKNCLKNTSQFFGFNPFISDNLCPEYEKILEKCKEFRNQNLINRYWVTNGTISIKLTNNQEEKAFKLFHVEDLYSLTNYDE